ILSFAFMGLMFFMTRGSAYKNGLINTVSYVQMQEGSNVAKAKIGVAAKSSAKGDLIITAEEKLATNIEVYDYYGGNFVDAQQEKCMYRILSGDTTQIVFHETPSWGLQQFTAQKNLDMGGSVESNVTLQGDKFVGEIVNNTNVDFYKFVLWLDGYGYEFDALGAGGTMQVTVGMDEVSKENARTYDQYRQYDEIREKVNSAEMTRKEAYASYLEHDLLGQVYPKEASGYALPIGFFGYSDVSVIEGEMKLNGKRVSENSLTMYYQNIVLDLSKQEAFRIGINGMIEGEGNYDLYEDASRKTVYSFEDTILEIDYTIPTDVYLDTIEFYGDGKYSYTVSENVKVYNRKTQQWDTVNLAEPIAAENYVDENNLIKASIHVVGNAETEVPRLYIEGGGLLA
ncbi:MAG: hypothetical protein ACK5I7_05185, partial [Anaerotignum sp.]